MDVPVRWLDPVPPNKGDKVIKMNIGVHKNMYMYIYCNFVATIK